VTLAQNNDENILGTREKDELNLLHLRFIKRKNALQKSLATFNKIKLSINGKGNLECASWLTT
jgi:hypothetical protein